MFKYISIIILVSLIFSNSFFSNFVKSNNTFFNNDFKSIDFNYKLINNIDTISDTGSASVIIGPNKYQIYLDDYILLFQGSLLKRYNKKTNQIFIEDSHTLLDSMIINFFTTEHFNQYKDSLNNHIVINTINGDFFLKLFIDNIQNHIDSIHILNNDLDIFLFNIVLSTESLDTGKLFKLDYPNAFILDLRD